MLTDALIDTHGRAISNEKLYSIFNGLSVPLAAQRITDLLNTDEVETIWEEVMIELELCISLVFKPVLHHLRSLLVDPGKFLILWKSVLGTVGLLLGDIDGDEANFPHMRTMDNLLSTTKELASEHLRNAVMVLTASKIISGESNDDGTDISSVTWNFISNMEYCREHVEEWKHAAVLEEDMIDNDKQKDKSVGSSEEGFDDLVIVSEVGEDTCESS